MEDWCVHRRRCWQRRERGAKPPDNSCNLLTAFHWPLIASCSLNRRNGWKKKRRDQKRSQQAQCPTHAVVEEEICLKRHVLRLNGWNRVCVGPRQFTPADRADALAGGALLGRRLQPKRSDRR